MRAFLSSSGDMSLQFSYPPSSSAAPGATFFATETFLPESSTGFVGGGAGAAILEARFDDNFSGSAGVGVAGAGAGLVVPMPLVAPDTGRSVITFGFFLPHPAMIMTTEQHTVTKSSTRVSRRDCIVSGI
ncbi:hypothetical protein PFISCL1PPCAC_21108, partial [Pristionchus fissidentatus]